VAGIAFATGTALLVVLAFMAPGRLIIEKSSYSAASGSRQPTVRISSADQCTSQWSRKLSNNTAGTVSLVSGAESFDRISSDRKELVVAPGQSLDGKVTLLVHNGGAPFARAPFIYTPSWGAPDKSWQLITKSVPDGATLYKPEVHLTAPSAQGIYHLIFAFQLEMTGADVASGTNWPIGHDVWDDGNEIADFIPEQIREAQSFGCTTARWLYDYGYGNETVPADAITISVR